jgi:hypothetical protein
MRMFQDMACLTYLNEKLTLWQGFPFCNTRNYAPVRFEAHTSVTLKINSFETLSHAVWQIVINVSEEPSSGQKTEAAETLVTIYQVHVITSPKTVIFKYVTD